MKEIIPLKKDIIFNTIIGVITNIEVDREYRVKDDIVEGSVLIDGTYKMTEASVLEEEFNYKIPFSIAISKRIKKDTILIEIENFEYETSKDVMSVSVNLELTCDEEKNEDDFMNEYFSDNDINVDKNSSEVEFENNIQVNDNNTYNNIDLNLEQEKETVVNNEKTDINIDENINNITNTIINNENKFYTYKVYIVRSSDTIESICNKYNVTLNDLKDYNDINNINVGDKIIIPQINE